MMSLIAPAKLNLCLYLGERRDDGLHHLCSLFEPIDLADRLTVAGVATGAETGVAGGDQVAVADGVELHGENTVTIALRELRAAGWDSPPLRVEIEKNIPVGAGLGGGSADAAAILRWAATEGNAAGQAEVENLGAISMRVGADVPFQLDPAFALVRGAGERIERLRRPAPHALLLLSDGGGLGTGAVFAEADRLGLGRSDVELDRVADQLREATASGVSPLEYAPLLVNDLEPAALSLRPQLAVGLEELRRAGAPHAGMTGSGSTLFGLFPDRAAAERAATRLNRPGIAVCEAGLPAALYGAGGEAP